MKNCFVAMGVEAREGNDLEEDLFFFDNGDDGQDIEPENF